MKEAILRDFFLGHVSAAVLSDDLTGSVVTSGNVSHHRIKDMPDEFEVQPEHLVRLCDAVLSGVIDAPDLQTVGFCLVASDTFFWDADTDAGARVADVVFPWSSPEINYRLTPETVEKFKARLTTGKDLFTRTDFS